MAISSQHVTGLLVGLGVAGLGFYVYKQNQAQIDEFLRKQGIQLPNQQKGDHAKMSLEELVAEKERLEDLIAERELETKEAK
jgi:hypothetical protein